MTQGYEHTTSLLQEMGAEADRLVRPADLQDVLVEGSLRARRRGRRRRTAGVAMLVAVAVAALVVPLPRLLRHGGAPASTRPSPQPAPPAEQPPAVSLARLRGGSWSRMAPSPLAPRSQAVIVWTGSQLIVWGGSATNGEHLYGDGAAYDPATNRWQLLPPSPLSPRDDAAAVWTGREMAVFGGFVDGQGQVASNQAAAYDPSSRRWRMLPAAPLSPRAGAVGADLGGQAVFLGGEPASDLSGPLDGAALDPLSGTWTHIRAMTPPAGHQEHVVTAVPEGGRLLAFTSWVENRDGGIFGGMDLFAYAPGSGGWRRIGVPASALPGPSEALTAGGEVVVRGSPYNCGTCPGPFAPEVTDLYDSARGSWTQLPPDPLGGDQELSAWTGDALVSYDAACRCGGHGPGSATLYDPARNAWSDIPTAPVGCGDALFWTGSQLLVACPTDGEPGAPGGLVYTPAPAIPPAGSLVLRLSLSRTSVTAGASLTAHVSVTNTTRRPVTLTGVCPNDWLAVGLTGPGIEFEALFVLPRCAPGVTLPPGTTTFAETIEATYRPCQLAEERTVSHCTPGGAIPLPPGRYRTTVTVIPGAVRGEVLPPPLTVTVLPKRS